jgi:hypothetical protein
MLVCDYVLKGRASHAMCSAQSDCVISCEDWWGGLIQAPGRDVTQWCGMGKEFRLPY